MKRTFPIPANCSKCGHKGELFIDDEMLYNEMEAYRKSRVTGIWASVVVPRIVGSWIAAGLLGIMLGALL